MAKKIITTAILFLIVPVYASALTGTFRIDKNKEINVGAITTDDWNTKIGTYLEPSYPEGRGILIKGSNRYANFNSIYGSSGYGIRDNSGTIQVKSYGGSWQDISTGSGTVTSVDMSVPTGLAISGNPITTSGTLALDLDTGYVIPLQSTLDNFATVFGDLNDVATSSDATGDIYYLNSSGQITNLAKGSQYQILNAGATLPEFTSTIGASGTRLDAYLGNASTTQLTATDAWITKLRNLTSNGFVKTGSGDGTLSIDTNTYLQNITGESIEDLSDVSSMTENYGDLFYWNGSNWDDIATSSLAINSDDVIEGSTNLFLTGNELVDGDFASNGLMARTSAGNYTNRDLATSTDIIVITNPDGVSGNPTFTLRSNSVDISDYTNLSAGTNISLSGDTLNVDDAFLVNDANDTMIGTLTADGLTLGADENITLGAQTLDHDGSTFVFSDTIEVGANNVNMTNADISGSITNWLGSACGAGEYVNDISDAGTFSCTDATTEINSEIGNVLDGTDAFTDFNGNDIIDTDNLNWGNFTDLGESGVVTWSNLASGELTSEVLIVGTDVKAGTLTDTKYCTWDSANSQVVCDSSGGTTSPGGSDTQIQYNNGGSFGGIAELTFNDATGQLTAGAFSFSSTTNASIRNETDAASNKVLLLKGPDRGTPQDDDEVYISFELEDDSSSFIEYARISGIADDVTNTDREGAISFDVEDRSSGLQQGMMIVNVSGHNQLLVDGGSNPPQPAYAFGDVPGSTAARTGMFQPASGVIGFSIDGTEEVRLGDTYLAIATTTPSTNAELDTYGDIILSGVNRYLNFDNTIGSTGYGIRDNAGTVEIKNSGGSWSGISSFSTIADINSNLSGESVASTTWSGATSIDTVGTITTGTWQATDVGVAYGGTGVSSLTDHGVLVGSGAGAVTALSVGTDGQILVGDTSNDPAFATLNCDDALTCTTGAGTLEIDFDGGSAPAGELGGTWASPTVDSGIFDDEYIQIGTSSVESITTLNNLATVGTLSGGTLALDSLSFSGDLNHEYGGLEADVSAYSGLLAISGGSISEVDAKSELESQIADVADFAEADGDIYSGTHDFSSATVKQHDYSSFSFPGGANTATTTTATTTIALGTAFTAEQWENVECFSGSGTISYNFTDGTNDMDALSATTTVSRFSLSTNNTFTAGEKRFVEIGTMTADYLSCTIDKIINN